MLKHSQIIIKENCKNWSTVDWHLQKATTEKITIASWNARGEAAWQKNTAHFWLFRISLPILNIILQRRLAQTKMSKCQRWNQIKTWLQRLKLQRAGGKDLID